MGQNRNGSGSICASSTAAWGRCSNSCGGGDSTEALTFFLRPTTATRRAPDMSISTPSSRGSGLALYTGRTDGFTSYDAILWMAGVGYSFLYLPHRTDTAIDWRTRPGVEMLRSY